MEKLWLVVGHGLVFAITALTIKTAVGDMQNGWEAALLSAALFNLGIQHIVGTNVRLEIRQREKERARIEEEANRAVD